MSNKGPATAEIEVKNTSVNPLSDIQKKAYEDAVNELQKAIKEMEGKKYTIDLKKEQIETLYNYITKDAPWNFNESLGIIEVDKVLAEAKKLGKLAIGAIAVEAIYYYLSKVTGKGLIPEAKSFESVNQYLDILKPFVKIRESIVSDQEKIKKLEFVAVSRSQGIEPDKTIAGPEK